MVQYPDSVMKVKNARLEQPDISFNVIDWTSSSRSMVAECMIAAGGVAGALVLENILYVSVYAHTFGRYVMWCVSDLVRGEFETKLVEKWISCATRSAWLPAPWVEVMCQSQFAFLGLTHCFNTDITMVWVHLPTLRTHHVGQPYWWGFSPCLGDPFFEHRAG